MKTSLHKELGPPLVRQFFDLAQDFLVCQHIGIRSARVTVERAEAAPGKADIGIVHVPVNHEGDNVFPMDSSADTVGQLSEGRQFRCQEKTEGFFPGERYTVFDPLSIFPRE